MSRPSDFLFQGVVIRRSQPVTDQIGQEVRVGKRIVFPTTRGMATGVVREAGPTFVRIHEDGEARVVTKKPWTCVVYGEAYVPALRDVA